MRSLRARLFAAILGAVLLAVGVSLAIGIVFTRDAARDTLTENLRRDADLLAARLRFLEGGPLHGIVEELPLPGIGGPDGRRQEPRIEPPPPGEAGPFALPGPRIGGVERGGLPPIIALEEADAVLPDPAAERLRAGEPASGTVTVDGERQRFEARPVGEAVALVTRPDIAGGDFDEYLSGLLIASGIGALLAAAVAAMVSRRLSAPLARVADASRVLAGGGSPDPVPRERTEELAALADAFNEMADQLDRAREAERSVLLSVSHDLRTPLTAIRGYAEGIEDGTVGADRGAAIVARESRRLERLVDDLLALARLRQGILEVRREPVDLHEVLGEAQERLRPQAQEAGVELMLEGGGDGRVVADHGRTLQVATNLVENAIRVTPAGGRVALTTGPGHFTVADSGPGIPPAERAHAFERFHLRDRLGRGSADGAGLGLAIVRELTVAMGGDVDVESEPGEGARFTVSLPRDRDVRSGE
jgi:two-component system, OmpR family, sensor kinase